ncbi:hypothetical protein LINPERPRIM_LOCUS1322 [Linum perenne]
MDALISSALEEICYRGSSGVALSSIWGKLSPAPSPSVKATLWSNLLSVPTLRFSVAGKDKLFGPDDPEIQLVEDAEKLKLKVVANEHLRDCFVGLYDIFQKLKDAGIVEEFDAKVNEKIFDGSRCAQDLALIKRKHMRGFMIWSLGLGCIVRQKTTKKLLYTGIGLLFIITLKPLLDCLLQHLHLVPSVLMLLTKPL